MSSLFRVAAVAANTFRETVRERVLYNLLVFAILMILSGLFLGQLSIYQEKKIVQDLGLAAMELFGNLIAAFIGVGLVSKEIERRSLYPLLAKPLSREELLLGKFLGLAYTLFVNLAVMTAGLYGTLFLTQARLNPHLLKAVYAMYLSLLLVVALALLLSTLASSTFAAVGTLCLMIAGRYTDVVQNMRDVAPHTPRWLVEGLYHVLPNLRSFDLKDHVVYGDPVTPVMLGWITAYAFSYVVVVLGLATLAFRSRDFQ